MNAGVTTDGTVSADVKIVKDISDAQFRLGIAEARFAARKFELGNDDPLVKRLRSEINLLLGEIIALFVQRAYVNG